MKKTIAILVIGALPIVATAGGDHADSHSASSGHAMERHEHASHGMGGMSHDSH